MSDEQKPLPCPHCGKSDRLTLRQYMADDDGGEPFPWGFNVLCNAMGFESDPRRGCGASGAWGETEAEAIAAWNRRVVLDELDASKARTLDVDALAQEIRRLGGTSVLGSGALAEALMPFLAALPVSREAVGVKAGTAFDDWWSSDGQYIDPDTSDVPWFDKRRGLAEYAYRAGGAATSRTAQRETGWLIELGSRVVVSPQWWSLPKDDEGQWTGDSLKALRFARREDAVAYINEAGWTEASASEHEWSDLSSSEHI
jgi:hypothetical protein